MNKFIRDFKNCVDLKLDEKINSNGEFIDSDAKNILLDTAYSKIVEYISFSKESFPESYFFSSMKLLEKPEDNSERFDSELVKVNGKNILQNFKILAYLGSHSDCEEFIFPNQNESIKVSPGSVFIYPTSFMFPYRRTHNSSLRVIELNYFFKKESVLDQIREGMGLDAVY